MATKRCELCGRLYGTISGSVVIAVPRPDIDYKSQDYYNLCEECSLKIYDMIDSLKISDGEKSEEHSALTDLILRQNAEIIKMRMCLRNAYYQLYDAMKIENEKDIPRKLQKHIETAFEWISKTEPYADE